MANDEVISIRGKEYEAIRKMLNDMFYNKTTINKEIIIEQTNWFLELLNERKEEDTYQYYFCYMMKNKCYYRLKKLKESIKYGELALKYVKQIKNMNYNRLMENLVIAIWGLGNAYAQIGNLKKAMRYYDKCEKYYEGKKDLLNLSNIYNTKAYYSFNIISVQKAINIKKELYKEEMNEIQVEDLDNTYDTLCCIYIHLKQYNKFFETLNKIQNTDKQKQIYKQYEETINKSNQLTL